MTWESLTVKIKDKIFVNIRPISIHLIQEKKYASHGKIWFIPVFKKKPTNRWIIKFIFDRGPLTFSHSCNIYFNSPIEAKKWFNHACLTINGDIPYTKTPTKSLKRHLRLVKDEL